MYDPAFKEELVGQDGRRGGGRGGGMKTKKCKHSKTSVGWFRVLVVVFV